MDIGTLTGQIEIDDKMSSVLTMVSSRVQRFAEGFDGAMGAVAIGVGAGVAAVGALSASIIALGNRGSDVNDLSNTLDQFAGSVQNAQAIMEGLRTGTLGTVRDFDLLKSSTKLLSAGVQLTASDFKTMSAAAFVLQNQGLGPTKDMLDMVSQAMLSGNLRSLKRIGIHVELEQVERDYAKTLGISAKDLNEVQKLEAKRIGIIEELNKRVQEAGAQQRDFGEQMEFAVTKIKNWGDELASAVAGSPAVMGAVDAIGAALKKAFGGESQWLMDWVVKWVNRFANAITQYGPIVVDWTKIIYDNVKHYGGIIIDWAASFIGHIKNIYDTVMSAWSTVPDWFKNIAKEAAILGGVLYITSGAVMAASKDIFSYANDVGTVISGLQDSIVLFGSRLAETGRGLKSLYQMTAAFGWAGFTVTISGWIAPLVLYTKGVWAATTATVALNAAMKLSIFGLAVYGVYELVKAYDRLGNAAKELARDLELVESKDIRHPGFNKALSNVVESQVGQIVGGLQQPSGGKASSIEDLLKIMDGIAVAAPPAAGGLKKMSESAQSLYDKISGNALAAKVTELTTVIGMFGGKMTGPQWGIAREEIRSLASAGAVLNQVLRNLAASPASFPMLEGIGDIEKMGGALSKLKTHLQLTGDQWQNFLDDFVKQDFKRKHPQFTMLEGGFLDPFKHMPVLQLGSNAGKGVALSFKQAFARSIEGLGSIVVGAIQGGGDVGRALGAAVGSSLGESIGASVTKKLGGGVFAKALGSFAGPLGALAGSALGSLIGSLFGPSKGKQELLAANADIEKFRKELLKTYGTLADIAKLDAALGTDVAVGWQHQGTVGAAAFAKSAQALADKLAKIHDEMSQIASEGGLASAELIKFRDAMPGDKDVQAFSLGQVRQAGGNVGGMLAAMQASATALAKARLGKEADDFVDDGAGNDIVGAMSVTATGAKAMASILLAAWDGSAQGLRDMQPSLAILQRAMENSGIAGGAAFERIGRLATIASDDIQGPMVDAINFGTAALTNMYNAGFLTQETFSGIVDEILAERAALIAAGASAADVDAIMQPSLQRIWELHKDGKLAVNDETQALLDQAIAQGTVGDKFRSATDRMVIALESIAEMFKTVFGDKLIAEITRGTTEAEAKIADLTRDRNVKIRVRTESDGTEGNPGGGWPGWPGETGSDRGGTAIIMLDGHVIAEAIVPKLPGVVQQYGLG